MDIVDDESNLRDTTGFLYYVVNSGVVARGLHDSVEKVIRKGALLEVLPTEDNGDEVIMKVLNDELLCIGKWDNTTVLYRCHRYTLVPVNPILLLALQAVPPLARITVAQNEQEFCQLTKLTVGEMVNYFLEDNKKDEPELALIKYKGFVEELGPGLYFGLEVLANNGDFNENGTKKYFPGTSGKTVFATLNQLGKYSRTKVSAFVDIYNQASKRSDIESQRLLPRVGESLMPSNEKKVQCQNGGNKDPGNFKTTLVLHLKDKTTMPRHQSSSSVEKTEKLIELKALDQFNTLRDKVVVKRTKLITNSIFVPYNLYRHSDVISDNGDLGQSVVQVGDRVVWVTDSGPEVGYIRWIGIFDDIPELKMAGVEFDNPIGTCNGSYKKNQLFRADMNCASFLPLISLIKADDYFPKKDTASKKFRNLKYIENYSNSKVAHHANSRSQVNSMKYSEPSFKTQRSESFHLTNPVIELTDTRDNDPFPEDNTNQRNGKGNICRSEYVFSESSLDSSTARLDNSNKSSVVTNSKNLNNSSKRNGTSYVDGDTCANNPGSSNFMSGPSRVSKPNETKMRHSYSQDMNNVGPDFQGDLLDELWPSVAESSQPKTKGTREDKKTRPVQGSNKKLSRFDINGDPQLEIVGEGIQNLLSTSAPGASNEHHEAFLSVSPGASSGGGSYYDTPNLADDSPEPALPTDLSVGSVVEVTINKEPRYGVIRWIGAVPEDRKARKVAGIEMEEEYAGLTDGTFNGRRYFQCNPKKAMFVNLSQCHKDSRFQDMHPVPADTKLKSECAAYDTFYKSRAFGQVDCPAIPGAVRPICRKGDLHDICGKYKGIQGHHNSCYLDATLFSMFTFTSVFDSLLFRPPTENDIVHYEEVQRVLREEIVNPLRANLYVRADRVMKLRTLLENLSSVTGLTSEEKDPEEFLTSLVAQILRAKPFLKLSSGQEAYHYQLFVEKDEHLTMPSVQQLFEQSFLATPRQCTVCGKLAEFECKECFGQCGAGLESTAFCGQCLETAHSHQRRSSHAWRHLTVPVEFSILQDHCPIPRLYMELFAVVCIETSHYVAFVKCGSGSEAPWCFFDSMADRKDLVSNKGQESLLNTDPPALRMAPTLNIVILLLPKLADLDIQQPGRSIGRTVLAREQNGYNIPEMVSCPDLPSWLSDDGAHLLHEMKDDRQLPEHAKRLLCDAYMCMYQSPDVMMYR
uniref:ubiquitinyl hydrolase 1 n=1 Tax=Timema poppense TaxID=170557 RepID=A0A7R9DDL8_TIMPO|nr:unnamed protein product [Timema poppensis]